MASKKITKALPFLLKRYLNTALFLFIVSFTLFPLIVLITKGNYTYLSSTTIYFVLYGIVLLVLAFVMPILMFIFANSKAASDVYFSLPIKRQDLFNQLFLTGILVALLPITANAMIGIAALSIKGSPFLLDSINSYGKLVFLFLVIYGFVSMIIQKCNNVVDGLVAAAILINLPFACYLATLTFMQTQLPGFPFKESFDIIAAINPIVMLFSSIGDSTIVWWVYALDAMLLFVFPIVASINFYQRRCESSGDVTTTWMIYPVIQYVATFISMLLTVVATNSTEFGVFSRYFLVFFIGMITFLLIYVISMRGFKGFFVAIRNYAIYGMISLLLMIGLVQTKGFGYTSRIPELQNIKSVTLSGETLAQLFNQYNDYGLELKYNFEDPLVITEVLKIHQLAIAQQENKDNYGPVSLELGYELGLGSMHRIYRNINYSDFSTDFYRAVLKAKIYLPFYTRLIKLYETDNYDNPLVQVSDQLGSQITKQTFTTDQVQELIKVIIEDVNQQTFAQLYEPEALPVTLITIGSQASDYYPGPNNGKPDPSYTDMITVPVLTTFTKTLAWLDAQQVAIPTINYQYITAIDRITQNSDSIDKYSEFSENMFVFQGYSSRWGNTIAIPIEEWEATLTKARHIRISDKKMTFINVTYKDGTIVSFALAE